MDDVPNENITVPVLGEDMRPSHNGSRYEKEVFVRHIGSTASPHSENKIAQSDKGSNLNRVIRSPSGW
jgi:hypothetical protein